MSSFVDVMATMMPIAIAAMTVATGIGVGLTGMKARLPDTDSFVLIRMAGLEKWKIPWFALPLGPALLCLVSFGIARRFGKGRLFGWGLLLLPYVFLPILAFGKAKYSPVELKPKRDQV